MGHDTDPSATGNLHRAHETQRPFVLGATFLFFGLALGVTMALAAMGAAALLTPEARATGTVHSTSTFSPAAALPRSAEAKPVATIAVADAGPPADTRSADLPVARPQRVKMRKAGPARTSRSAKAETSVTLGELAR